jgi:radical SAM superfamily enzyme YgiQ (UPF0313 family)
VAEVILTAPATEMSDHHGKEFLGFGTCCPQEFIPAFLIKNLFYPKVKTERGLAKFAPYGLRKIEAILSEHFDVLTVHPYDIEDYLDDAKVVGVSVMDPLGYGPVSITFASLVQGTPSTRVEFLHLMDKLRNYNCRIIVGGAGAWQLELEDLEVDCVVVGEAESVVLDLFRRALNGESIPKKIVARSPSLDEIPIIKNASVNGLVEISRGCGRGCKFCSTTGLRRQDIPMERILQEVRVNLRNGSKGIILHSEDVLLYGSRLIPDERKVTVLFRRVRELTPNIGMSHCSFASVAANPELVEEITDIIGTDFIGVQTGMETGSPRLIAKYMHAKAYPFNSEDWKEVVVQAFEIMEENNWIPAVTLVVGLPEENEEDIAETLDLLDRVSKYRSLIVPLFFIPMKTSALKSERLFRFEDMKPLHYEVFRKCAEHNLRHVDSIMKKYMRGVKGAILRNGYFALKRWFERRFREIDWKEVIGS